MAGSLVLLSGPMGIGKTEWVRGFASGLGIPDRMKSPTFLYLQSFDPPAGSKIPGLLHADWDRVGGSSEDLEEALLDRLEGRVTLVEWGEKLPDSVIRSFLMSVHILFSWSGSGRQIVIRWASSAPHRESLLCWRELFDLRARGQGLTSCVDRRQQ